MMRASILVALIASALAGPATAQAVTEAPAGSVRVLDKLTGDVTDLTIERGQTMRIGFLTVTMVSCRYPASNPSGDAYAELVVRYREAAEPSFAGWMLASSPALNGMDHPRYDVWPLRCSTS